MTFEEFDKVSEEIFGQVRNMRDTKGKEYARDDADRFANFNRLAKELGLLREQVLWVYISKHLDAIVSYVNMGRVFSSEPIEGRIVDAITYLTLLAGIARENNKQLEMPSAETLKHHNTIAEELELSLVQCRCYTEARPDHSTRVNSTTCPLHRGSA